MSVRRVDDDIPCWDEDSEQEPTRVVAWDRCPRHGRFMVEHGCVACELAPLGPTDPPQAHETNRAPCKGCGAPGHRCTLPRLEPAPPTADPDTFAECLAVRSIVWRMWLVSALAKRLHADMERDRTTSEETRQAMFYCADLLHEHATAVNKLA